MQTRCRGLADWVACLTGDTLGWAEWAGWMLSRAVPTGVPFGVSAMSSTEGWWVPTAHQTVAPSAGHGQALQKAAESV